MAQQERDDLERVAARLAHPALVRILLEVLDALELVVADGVVDVSGAFAIGERRDAAGFEHAHHHRGAGAGQPRHDVDRASVPAALEPVANRVGAGHERFSAS